MQNITYENDENDKTLQSSSPSTASTSEPIMKPQDGQTEKVSTCENLSTAKRPYGSMPNLTASITTGDDTAAAVQAPTVAVAVQQISAEPLESENCAEPQMRENIGLMNAAVVVPPAAAAEKDVIRSPSVTSDRKVSEGPKHDGSGELQDAKMSRDFAVRLPGRLWYSMPNIAIHYTDKVFYETTEIECIAPTLVSSDSLTTATEPADEITPVKIKRRSMWKRARKFVRRVFCCAA
ncbi:uncharacterized protein LOC126549845 [Aphis gossypii]|uniref:uncharacterized protein LOC126549845 n=1 Tax=Aphis gossypii TaxID=80765 RepID=UPI002158B1E6|nr:uncharacterized protein LOC126549845 [Aphis gossypii]XP_050056197.1 uncharacterized protein LOC126549845 [Aphis gossypii]